MPQLSYPLKDLLLEQIRLAQTQDRDTLRFNSNGDVLDIPRTGKLVSTAYEQLRNVAEHSEEHLLLQRAIKRFYKRNLLLNKWRLRPMGNELIVELSQAGYLKQGRFSRNSAAELDRIANGYSAVHAQLRDTHISRSDADTWVLELIATQAENLLNPHNLLRTTAVVAYQHFLEVLPRESFAGAADFADYELCLYIAVEQAILRADIDVVRYELLQLFRQSPDQIASFTHFNQQIDRLFVSELTLRLRRIVNRHGAPFRVLRSMLAAPRSDIAELAQDREQFMAAYDTQLASEYRALPHRLNRGLLKSVLFILVTKVLIGLGIEIPYDLITKGFVARLPLAVNLLFPPLYMASLKLSLLPPLSSNKQTIHTYMEKVLYDGSDIRPSIPRRHRTSLTKSGLYALLLAIPVVIAFFVLQRIGLSIVQMVIFFVFFSTASFLGFRLGTMMWDWELVLRKPGFTSSIRNFFYLPFIVTGQWLAHKYTRLNIVARFLDIAIELPLKSLLRLLRQWINFLNELHENLYS